MFERRGLFELESFPEHALDALRRDAAQQRLPIGVGPTPPRTSRRCAFLGATHLVLSPLQLLQRLVALIPPPRFNLTASMASSRRTRS